MLHSSRRAIPLVIAIASLGGLAVAQDTPSSTPATPAPAPSAPATTPAPASAPAKPAAPPEKPAADASAGAKPRSPAANFGGYVRAMDWSLDFAPGPLRLFIDPTTKKTYWYFTYKVVNRTGKERMWAPKFQFFSDKGEILTSGNTVPTDVTRAIMALLGNPLLQDQYQVMGDILIGEEHAKEGLVVWPAEDLSVTEFTVFIAGASGKTRKTPDPRTGLAHVERWTIRLNYLVPGDPTERGSKPVDPASIDLDLKEGAARRRDAGVWLWR